MKNAFTAFMHTSAQVSAFFHGKIRKTSDLIRSAILPKKYMASTAPNTFRRNMSTGCSKEPRNPNQSCHRYRRVMFS